MLRGQVGLEKRLAHFLDLILEFESFYRLDNQNEIRQLRNSLGLKWELNKRADLLTSFQMDREFNVKEPIRQAVVNLAFSFDI